MGKPIYHCWRATPTDAWYQLSKEEQDALFQKVQAALPQVGGKSVIDCDARWASEAWFAFGVEEFPDVEALQRYTQIVTDLNWYRYIRAESLLGTAFDSPA